MQVYSRRHLLTLLKCKYACDLESCELAGIVSETPSIPSLCSDVSSHLEFENMFSNRCRIILIPNNVITLAFTILTT